MHGEKAEPVKVLITLKSAADDACLGSLQKLGLVVKEVHENKVTGEIPSQLLTTLEQHEAVSDVERSVRLRPTDAGDLDS